MLVREYTRAVLTAKTLSLATISRLGADNIHKMLCIRSDILRKHPLLVGQYTMAVPKGVYSPDTLRQAVRSSSGFILIGSSGRPGALGGAR